MGVYRAMAANTIRRSRLPELCEIIRRHADVAENLAQCSGSQRAIAMHRH